jgi:hypothetical protein
MRRSTKVSAVRVVAVLVGFGTLLASCSDIYYDRRETVLFGADNAVATAIAVQTIDPWPPASANRRAPANGERVAAAIARYRAGRVIPPQGNGTSSAYQQQQQQSQQNNGAASGPAGVPTH